MTHIVGCCYKYTRATYDCFCYSRLTVCNLLLILHVLLIDSFNPSLEQGIRAYLFDLCSYKLFLLYKKASMWNVQFLMFSLVLCVLQHVWQPVTFKYQHRSNESPSPICYATSLWQIQYIMWMYKILTEHRAQISSLATSQTLSLYGQMEKRLNLCFVCVCAGAHCQHVGGGQSCSEQTALVSVRQRDRRGWLRGTDPHLRCRRGETVEFT